MNKEQWKLEKMKQDALIRRVFSSPEGAALLELLTNEYLFSPIHSNDVNVVMKRIGKQELVILFNEATRGKIE